MEKYHYIELKRLDGKNIKNVKNRLDNKLENFKYSKQKMQGK